VKGEKKLAIVLNELRNNYKILNSEAWKSFVGSWFAASEEVPKSVLPVSRLSTSRVEEKAEVVPHLPVHSPFGTAYGPTYPFPQPPATAPLICTLSRTRLIIVLSQRLIRLGISSGVIGVQRPISSLFIGRPGILLAYPIAFYK
jgi:hypothetical protein